MNRTLFLLWSVLVAVMGIPSDGFANNDTQYTLVVQSLNDATKIFEHCKRTGTGYLTAGRKEELSNTEFCELPLFTIKSKKTGFSFDKCYKVSNFYEITSNNLSKITEGLKNLVNEKYRKLLLEHLQALIDHKMTYKMLEESLKHFLSTSKYDSILILIENKSKTQARAYKCLIGKVFDARSFEPVKRIYGDIPMVIKE